MFIIIDLPQLPQQTMEWSLLMELKETEASAQTSQPLIITRKSQNIPQMSFFWKSWWTQRSTLNREKPSRGWLKSVKGAQTPNSLTLTTWGLSCLTTRSWRPVSTRRPSMQGSSSLWKSAFTKWAAGSTAKRMAAILWLILFGSLKEKIETRIWRRSWI